MILNLPEESEVVDGPSGAIIKTGDTYFSPEIEYVHTKQFNSKEMRFSEPDEDSSDVIYASLSRETLKITKL